MFEGRLTRLCAWADVEFADIVELTAGIARVAADSSRADRLLTLTLDGLRP